MLALSAGRPDRILKLFYQCLRANGKNVSLPCRYHAQTHPPHETRPQKSAFSPRRQMLKNKKSMAMTRMRTQRILTNWQLAIAHPQFTLCA
jgi:hypothetical protein